MNSQPDELSQWIGNCLVEQDQITQAPVRAMAALLDQDPARIDRLKFLPPLWHWLYFLSPARQSLLADDGHPFRGEFLPPVALPRRMWAGGRLEFYHGIPLLAVATRTSTVKDVRVKRGRSGELVFVEVAHAISVGGEQVLLEEHDIVYRERPNSGLPAAGNAESAPQAEFRTHYSADATFLFRYSALTFNAHRIHYDRDWAMQREGYGGLVVHGPLLATLLMELCRDRFPHATVEKFSFRAEQPVFDDKPFSACGRLTDPDSCELWIADHQDRVCMRATARFRQ